MGAIVVFLGLKVFISDDSQIFSAVIMRKSLKREAAIKKKICIQNYKQWYHTWPAKDFKDTVENRYIATIVGKLKWSLGITLAAPLMVNEGYLLQRCKLNFFKLVRDFKGEFLVFVHIYWYMIVKEEIFFFIEFFVQFFVWGGCRFWKYMICSFVSGGMLVQKLNPNDLQFENLKPFDGTMAYAQNKRQQIVMTEQYAQVYIYIVQICLTMHRTL